MSASGPSGPLVCGGSVFGPCFVMPYLVSFLDLLDGEERAGCFTLIVFLMLTVKCQIKCCELQHFIWHFTVC